MNTNGEDPEENVSISEWDLIKYALRPERLLFIDCPEYWEDFHSENPLKWHTYNEYSTYQLCEIFLQRILPQINKFVINEQESYMLKLLDFHPGFRRTENGFVKHNEMETIDYRRVDDETSTTENTVNLSQDLILDHNADLNRQVVIMTIDNVDSQYDARPHSQLTKENAALLSVTLSAAVDLPTCELLPTDEMLKRLRDSKVLFERNGHQLEHVSCSIEGLIDKLNTLYELKQTITELNRKCFSLN